MNAYLEKYGFQEPKIIHPVSDDLNIIVVIPCHNEPNICETLDALQICEQPTLEVEVIIVINHSEIAEESIIVRNQQTKEEVGVWLSVNKPFFNCFTIVEVTLPKKHAGVGLARKIGMDEAVNRFDKIDKQNGVIVCLDADCKVASNYFQAIEHHFQMETKTPGCAIQYQHPLEGDEYTDLHYSGIINYELFLRYYNLGLIYAGFPYGYHTVGSSMAVRSLTYQKQGGMNKRKAGEDFYFLHKIISLGGFTELNTTCVFPSPRTSDRVPFGTGKAMHDFLNSDNYTQYPTYDVKVFDILKSLIDDLLLIYESNDYKSKREVLNQFNNSIAFHDKVNEIKNNTTDFKSFKKRFFQFFDAFKVLKFVHFARDNGYPNKEIKGEVLELCKWMNIQPANDKLDKKSLLLHLRVIEAKRS